MELIKEIPKGIIRWYSFPAYSKILCITQTYNDSDTIFNTIKEMELYTERITLSDLISGNFNAEFYDYVVGIDIIEYTESPVVLLQAIKKSLKKDGKLLLGTDNRLGVRYFCGDRDPFTERNFDGVENYLCVNPEDMKQLKGRAYAKAELISFLEHSGFSYYKFYSILPELTAPQVLIAQDYIPNEELDIRIFPQYNSPSTVFLEEEKLYASLLQNNMLHTMANGFFIECPLDGVFSDVNQVTVSMCRGEENAMCTIISSNKVEKKPLYKKGEIKLKKLLDNNQYLTAHGINMVEAEIVADSLRMPLINAQPATNYFRNILLQDKEKFWIILDEYWNLILHSSEHVPYDDVDWEKFDPYWYKRKPDDPNKDKWRKIVFGTQEEKENLGVILKRGYIDLVSLNCFYAEDKFLFFDQELYVENLPAKAILLRTIDFIYEFNRKFELIIPKKLVLEKFHLNEYMDIYYKYIEKFLVEFRNDDKLADYYEKRRRDTGIINMNRQRMNYSEQEYHHMFRDIFCHIEGRKLYIFGSGRFAKRFISQFGKEYEITGLLDNQKQKWGTKVEGIEVFNPDILKNMDKARLKIIICIKNYISVVKQLESMEIYNFSIYDSYLEYPRKQMVAKSINDENILKKYNVGYIAGVFDLFHIGHLNLLRKAKEQCNYLIVGVVTDEGVRKHKKTNPEIPFQERKEIVGACKYVDEVVEIPLDWGGTDEAYRRYQFDVQFSGDDYANDPGWIASKKLLQKHGADLVFFPYTKSTSSTKIKESLKKKGI